MKAKFTKKDNNLIIEAIHPVSNRVIWSWSRIMPSDLINLINKQFPNLYLKIYKKNGDLEIREPFK